VNRYIKKYEEARTLSEERHSPSSTVEWMKETLASLREEDLRARTGNSPQQALDPHLTKVLYSVLRFLGEMEESLH
jgi:hypothetical protein